MHRGRTCAGILSSALYLVAAAAAAENCSPRSFACPHLALRLCALASGLMFQDHRLASTVENSGYDSYRGYSTAVSTTSNWSTCLLSVNSYLHNEQAPRKVISENMASAFNSRSRSQRYHWTMKGCSGDRAKHQHRALSILPTFKHANRPLGRIFHSTLGFTIFFVLSGSCIKIQASFVPDCCL